MRIAHLSISLGFVPTVADEISLDPANCIQP